MARPKSKESGILAAAAEVFAEKGFAGTSIQDIAKRAGIGKGTIYDYYKSKDELFIHSIKTDISQLIAYIGNRCEVENSFSGKLRVLIESMQHVISEEFSRLEFFFISNVKVVKPETVCDCKSMMDEAKEELEKLLSRVLQLGIAEGRVYKEIDTSFAAGFVGDAIILHCERCREKGYPVEKVKESNDKLINMIMRGIEAR